MKKIVFVSALILISFVSFGQKYEVNWESIDSRKVPQWFEDAKFGIFIHWGIYSVPAWAPADADISIYGKYAEWYWWRINEESRVGKLFREYHNQTYGEGVKYQDFISQFTARHFQPDEWARLFANAGAKYVILTSKHVEGFALWPSEQSWNWNSADVGPHRDLCGDLSKAVKNAGLNMGFYYCMYEWYNPLYKNNLEKYVDTRMIPQMKDLVIRYKPDILWTDGEWDHPSEKWKSKEFIAWLFNESPVKDRICINDRWGKETRGKHGGYFTTEYSLVHNDANVSYTNHPWEECRGIGTSFGYNRTEDLSNYLSSDQLVDLLIEKVAAGGNLLLNVGPTADGRIPVIMQQRLTDIGSWLDVNGESIYGTRRWEGSKNQNQKNLYFTKKGNDLFVLCTQFPEKKITINAIPGNPNQVKMLGINKKIKIDYADNNLTIYTPEVTPGNSPCRFAWVYKIENVF